MSWRSRRDEGRARGRIVSILLAIILVVGLGIMLYPIAGRLLARQSQTKVIREYESQVDRLSEKRLSKMQKKIEEYVNAHATGRQEEDSETHDSQDDDNVTEQETSHKQQEEKLPSYANVLDIGEVMGYVEIPKLDISLPIYHGTDDITLQKGVGHMEGTSLPVGGKGTHCVLAGHSGLAGTTLFSELDQMEIGDKFYVTVLEDKMAYRVDQIEVVKPTDLTVLEPAAGKDYVTLLTCTPKGSNTHRLLVRGVRTKEAVKASADTSEKGGKHKWLAVAAILCGVAGMTSATLLIRKRKHEERDAEAMEEL